ncbi:hypothetical protein M3Y95_00169100 [Aphelenchoides besseyi]|nr:hypothetical protein M3Y95_00169100 [Aphelenchoides besseyi]
MLFSSFFRAMTSVLWIFLFASFISLTYAADLGFNLGSKAASQLVSHGIHSVLQQPRRLDLELVSSKNPWFDPVAHFDAKARVLMRNMDVRFHDDLVDVQMMNLTVYLTSDMVLPLPFYLGEDTANIHAEIPYADIRLKVEDLKLALDKCDVGDGPIDVRLEHSVFLNYMVKPFVQLVPRSLVQSAVCNSIADPLTSLRNNYTIEIPLVNLIPPKFQRHMRQKNTTLKIELQSVESRDEQLTMSAHIKWGSKELDDLQIAEATEMPLTTIFDEMNAESEMLRDDNVQKLAERELYERRLELWVEDALVNEIVELFDWTFEWMSERIPVNSTKLPRSTREFLAVLCADCYFELKVFANGPPHLTTGNKSLTSTQLISRTYRSNRMSLKVVNPTSNIQSVFISFSSLNITVQVLPQIEDGTFRTQINLLNTSIKVGIGAFPSAWNVFIQDLVHDMVRDVVWPALKKEIENLTYSNGIRIPSHCGLEPSSTSLYVDDSRFGVSTSLLLDELSTGNCLRQLRSKLPDPSKFLVIDPTQ